jgi:DNA-binding NarL/FixJ family response regulator
MINVMLVDDQTLLREGIKSLLALSEDIKVVAKQVMVSKCLQFYWPQ